MDVCRCTSANCFVIDLCFFGKLGCWPTFGHRYVLCRLGRQRRMVSCIAIYVWMTCGLRLLANKFLPLTCSANQPINHSVICSVLTLYVYSFILSLFRSFMFSSPDAFIQFFLVPSCFHPSIHLDALVFSYLHSLILPAFAPFLPSPPLHFHCFIPSLLHSFISSLLPSFLHSLILHSFIPSFFSHFSITHREPPV